MKQRFRLPYGKAEIAFTLPAGSTPTLVLPPETPTLPDPAEAVQIALQRSVEKLTIPRAGHSSKVAIAIVDSTRPAANHIILPPLLAWLLERGFSLSRINLCIASGIHPIPDAQEIRQLVPGDLTSLCTVTPHDPGDQRILTHLGSTSLGTPVWIHRDFVEADLRIVLGVIAPHQFQGFSGGAKAAAIGLAGRETIEQNHSRMVDPEACLGLYENNPTRQEVEEIGRMIGIQLAINIILNHEGQLVAALAGLPEQVMKEGIPICKQASCAAVEHRFDLVIASAGGHPRDLNLYQAQKALAHACLITTAKGAVILAAACVQGSGSTLFEQAASGTPSASAFIQKFQEGGFKLGSHKAYQIARDTESRDVFLLSDLDPQQVREFFLRPVQKVEDALEVLPMDLLEVQIAVMPFASTTIPVLPAAEVRSFDF
jgi:nickel-dependent lactate racemase